MRLQGDGLALSATDLASFLGCRHRTALDMAAALGVRRRPFWTDPLRDILFARGLEHERAYVAALRAEGLDVVDLGGVKDAAEAVARTLEAMRAGRDVVVQAALQQGRWYGRPDVLRRIDAPSPLGAWSYEVADAKLAADTRAGTILQLCLYSEMLRGVQGLQPEFFRVVVPPTSIQTYRTDDYAAYFRWVRARMEGFVAGDHEALAAAHYPEPVDHCEVCAWSPDCRKKRRSDDHLSLVAGISRSQRRELEPRDIGTLTALARLPLPIAFRPSRGAVETYVRVREQARLQLDSRDRLFPLHELRALEEAKGLARLPEPSPGDVFLDLEGDAFAREGGREYLFGLVTIDPAGGPVYRAFWALDDQEEQRAFEAVMDLIAARLQAHEGMHVYHYAPYEPSAFKRLMGRYATRVDALDALLRGGRFVDLYGVVRQGVLAGIERYSIKNLEVLFGFERTVALPDANRALIAMEQALELGQPRSAPQAVRDVVEGYNQDDCVSALRLRSWLEGLRAEAIARGGAIPRPVAPSAEPSEKVDDRAQRVEALRLRLLEGVPEIRSDRDHEQHARWLLAFLLDWHRREDKATWWEYFRLRDLPAEELFDEPQAVAGLELVERVDVTLNAKTGKPTGSVVDRYRYPAQEMEIRARDELKVGGIRKFADVIAVDREALTIDLKKGPKLADVHPPAAFAHKHVAVDVLENALFAMGERVATSGLFGADAIPIVRDLLLAAPPRLPEGPFAMTQGEEPLDFAVRVGADLDDSLLAIQGPPGSGKTFTGAAMICSLVAAGRKVGVAAVSHKVVENLLLAVHRAAAKTGLRVRLARKDDREDAVSSAEIEVLTDNGDALAALQSGSADVLGGTAWLWARTDFARAVDVLFVDEAGQMSLANVLAMSGAAKSIVLLGDPQQLEQPRKGVHPEGVGASALQHMLGPHATMPVDRGLFLPITWRLAPPIAAFTSELFYEGRLTSKPGLERQRLVGVAPLDGFGLWFADVEHDGNRNWSAEEIEVVAGLVARLIAPGAAWVDEDGVVNQMTGSDVLVVAPYNAHVVRLAERLAPTGARVGTVDKFQGQEAPVVIYSMATSRPEDAPRGLEFLYSPNRLNVATSRARCAVILVASPALFAPECRTPRQMQLANALSRYREMARPVPPA